MGDSGRLWAIREVTSRTSRSLPELAQGVRVGELFGANTFDVGAMKQKLPKAVFESLQETIRRGKKLDPAIASEVAHAVKEWALERGATHFCHWFQPQTGLTAEKHDAFLTFDDDGAPMERFSGSQLIQSEPDASSFPSGGMRTTFEARGYTAWDPSSPVFVIEGPNGKTLCIPSVFISYHGDALDNKTPLLRSMEVLSERALEVLRLFGDTSSVRVVPTVGPEQEYFLIDRAFWTLRPDLVSCGRTLIGGKPPKGQELEDHYFGSIKDRILAFMQETEYELYKLGIPIKTRHNEVAPSQYETAPIFEEANVASDHNQIVMETMSRLARRHNLACLLHEKPFAGVNGSGKHCNWSMMDSQGRNLLDPGATPERNLEFLVFLAAVLKGVHRRAGLLRAAIASSGNDHRLGANEAPPAIISVFLGDQLTRILDGLERGDIKGAAGMERIALGIRQLPEVARDNTDRNRTSPFAFTGNKFEFRAVSSASSISIPVAVLNAAVAEALGEAEASLRARLGEGRGLPDAVLDYARQIAVETKAIRFEGNNYAAEWVDEAKRRGLPNLRSSPEALAELVKPDSVDFFKRMRVFSEAETEARYHVRMERYVKDIEIEVEALKNLVSTHVLPSAYRQHALLSGAGARKAISVALDRLGSQMDELMARLAELQSVSDKAGAESHLERKAVVLAEQVFPAMLAVREVCDRIEDSVSDEFWTLPKYREMLLLV
ncbi:MAG TPA: glutamine synthetase III [Vicinamibacteria bacterium]|nr:glutamine synthetase III [Vicinamibacteria bacterium]